MYLSLSLIKPLPRMCFHFSLTQKIAIIETGLRASWEGAEWQPIYHASGFSFRHMPVLTQTSPNLLQPMIWGLIPSWVKSTEQANEMRALTLNARSESIFEKPSFRKPAQNQRCLIPADGFFEWMEHNGHKYPHFITMKSDSFFCFGGLYDRWVNPNSGEIIDSFSIITTPANAMMARIHNRKKRMPLIIPRECWLEWLNPAAGKSDLEQLCVPFPDTQMQAHSISKRITDRYQDSNVPETLEPFNYPELEA
jgi:putative SOS response-associated peptidase YedK